MSDRGQTLSLHYQAVTEPHLWSPGPSTSSYIFVTHPNGASLSIAQFADCWIISKHVYVKRTLAYVPKASPLKGLAGVIADTQRATGAEARAQIDRVLLEIQAWALTQPGPVDRILLTRDARSVMFYGPTGLRTIPHVLPEDLSQRLNALGHVVLPETGTGLLTNTSNISLEMPQTAHAKMALRASLPGE